MEIELTGEHADELAADFYTWLCNDRLPGVLLDRKRALPKPGTMGPEWLPVVTAALASPLVVEVVKSFLRLKRTYLYLIVVTAEKFWQMKWAVQTLQL